MNDEIHGIDIFIIGFLFIAVALTSYFCEKQGYEKGQIDCLNGKVKYELRLNADKTTEWVELKPVRKRKGK